MRYWARTAVPATRPSHLKKGLAALAIVFFSEIFKQRKWPVHPYAQSPFGYWAILSVAAAADNEGLSHMPCGSHALDFFP